MSDTSQWDVRPFQQSDADAVYSVLRQHITGDSLRESYHFPVDEFCSETSPHAAFVATVDGTPIGVSCIYIVEDISEIQRLLNGTTSPERTTLDPECTIARAGYLASGYIDPEWTGNGIGRALLERCEEYARTVECDAIFSEVWLYDAETDGRGIMDATGYTTVFEEPTEYWGVTEDADDPTCSKCGDDCSCGGQVRRKWV